MSAPRPRMHLEIAWTRRARTGTSGVMKALWIPVAAVSLLALSACGGSSSEPREVAAPAPSSASASADPTNETFEGLALGLPAASVEKRFGAPDQKGTPTEMGATGAFEADWEWKSLGLRLRMSAATAEAAPTVGAIEIEPPSKLRTSRGIGLGATRAEVEAAYRDALGKGREPDEPDATSETRLILGSVYGGTIFRFEGGKLVSVFVGAAAE